MDAQKYHARLQRSKGFLKDLPCLPCFPPPLALESSYLCGLESWNSRVGEYKDREDRRKENVQTACGGHRENREMKGVDWGLGKAPSREQRQGED